MQKSNTQSMGFCSKIPSSENVVKSIENPNYRTLLVSDWKKRTEPAEMASYSDVNSNLREKPGQTLIINLMEAIFRHSPAVFEA